MCVGGSGTGRTTENLMIIGMVVPIESRSRKEGKEGVPSEKEVREYREQGG